LKDNSNFLDFEKKIFSAGEDTRIFHVNCTQQFGGDKSLSDYLVGFNSHRELIAENCKFNILLWMSKEDTSLFAVNSPDMWDWRAAVLDFTLEIVPEKYDPENTNSAKPKGDALIKLTDRITEIEQYLAKKNPLPNQKAILLKELGELYESTGNNDSMPIMPREIPEK
jgi:hypothetical protein